MKLSLTELIIMILLGCGITYFVAKSQYDNKQIPVKTDTVYVKADTVYKEKNIFVKLPGKIDTVMVINDEGDSVKNIVASADTLIEKDSSVIHVKYFFPPMNYFDVDMSLKERVVTIYRDVMKYIEIKKPWYDKFWIGAGTVMMLLLTLGLVFGGK